MKMEKENLLRMPDWITLELEGKALSFPGNSSAVSGDIRLELTEEGERLSVKLTAENTPVERVRLRWARRFAPGCRILSGAWERGYGDLEWRGMVPERVMPWYFLAAERDGNQTPKDGCTPDNATVVACGVAVRPSALCFWQVDRDGMTLFLDVRSGGTGVLLQGRTLHAADVLFRTYPEGNTFDSARRFCGVLCADPILPSHPVYGGNNWYYAYGQSSQEDILADAAFLARLAEGLPNPPYMVIDAGWQENHDSVSVGGNWRRGNRRFPDMKGLADSMKALGVRPGIWARLLWSDEGKLPEEAFLQRDPGYLDPSHPDVLRQVEEDVRGFSDWGYQLIKHDFTTFDIFGRWGFQMGMEITDSGWHFWDRSKTSAEIIVGLYRAILRGAGDSLILGCNCMGHLGAGLMHLNRTGDDTSGKQWERTRKMGVNTLAFTLPQNRSFFAIDADCVGITDQVPWDLNRQWLDILARSGSPLFVSMRPGTADAEQEAALKAAFAAASRQKEHTVPLDWMETTCPGEWAVDGERVEYHWFEAAGLSGLMP